MQRAGLGRRGGLHCGGSQYLGRGASRSRPLRCGVRVSVTYEGRGGLRGALDLHAELLCTVCRERSDDVFARDDEYTVGFFDVGRRDHAHSRPPYARSAATPALAAA